LVDVNYLINNIIKLRTILNYIFLGVILSASIIINIHPIKKEDYELAAELFNKCRAKGIQGSNTDFLICSIALKNDFYIYTASFFDLWLPRRTASSIRSSFKAKFVAIVNL